MLNAKQFEEIAQKLYAALPAGMKDLESEIKHTFKDILQSKFASLDLVTREEFDVQRKILARTREKIESLEKQINQLISNQKGKTPKS